MTWKKGQSGNPGGQSKGSRRLLTDAFIRALARDWADHGEAVIKCVREENPVAYFNGMIKLIPHQVEADIDHNNSLGYQAKDDIDYASIQERRNQFEQAN